MYTGKENLNDGIHTAQHKDEHPGYLVSLQNNLSKTDEG